jgi:hypothetical protein
MEPASLLVRESWVPETLGRLIEESQRTPQPIGLLAPLRREAARSGGGLCEGCVIGILRHRLDMVPGLLFQ